VATNFKKLTAAAKAKVVKAEFAALEARLSAVSEIMEGASVGDAMLIAAEVLSAVAPICCEEHLDEFAKDFLQLLNDRVDAIAEQEAQDAADADGASDAPPPHLH
jgi:hypothetical protein